MNLKSFFRKNKVLYAMNAYFKAVQTKRNYAGIRKHYETLSTTILPSEREITYEHDETSSKLTVSLQTRDNKRSPIIKGDLRIIYVGTDEEQDYCGIIQGLQKYGDVIPFEQKPGIYGQMVSNAGNTDIAIFNGRRLISIVQDALESGPVHAVIGQMWGWTMDYRSLQTVRNIGIPVINISMDDRHTFRLRKIDGKWCGTSALIGSIDLACTTAKECCLWYQIEGCPSIYLPEASDSELFKPNNFPKAYDVCFVGANYGIRNKIVKTIEKKGVKVQCYGNGWPNGRLATRKLPIVFSQSRIILGIGTIGHCKDLYSLKMRDFDGPMSGSLYLTHDNPDLYELYEIGKEIETYRNPEECCEKIEYYLSEPLKAEAIAKAGRDRAVKEHTWEKRFEKVFRTLRILKKENTNR